MQQLPTLTSIAANAAIVAFKEYATLLPEGETLELYRCLLKLRMEFRSFFLDETQAQQYWDLIRDDEDLLDFVSRATIHFQLQFPGEAEFPQLTYPCYTQKLAGALGGVSKLGAEGGVVDDAYAGKLTDNALAIKLLDAEGWLVFLLTLETVLSQVIPRAVQLAFRRGGQPTAEELNQ